MMRRWWGLAPLLAALLAGCGSPAYLVPPSPGVSSIAVNYQQAVEIHQNAINAQLGQAIHGEEEALAANPRWVLGIRRLAQLFLESGQPQAALAELQDACRVDPGNAENWLLLGQLAAQLNQEGAAEQAYRQSLRLNPAQWQAWDGLAALALNRRQWLAAWNDADAAQYTGGNQAPTFDVMGRVLAGEGDWTDAMPYFVDAQQTDPGWWQPYYDLARGDLHFGDRQEAIDNLEQALTEDPANYAAWHLLARITATPSP